MSRAPHLNDSSFFVLHKTFRCKHCFPSKTLFPVISSIQLIRTLSINHLCSTRAMFTNMYQILRFPIKFIFPFFHTPSLRSIDYWYQSQEYMQAFTMPSYTQTSGYE